MASVNLKGGDTWQASIRVWVADPSDSAKGEWRRTWRTTGIPASSPKSEAEKVAEAIQAAANAVSPQNPRRADQRVFVEMLEAVWRTAGVAPPQVSSTWRKFSAEYLLTGSRTARTTAVTRSRIKTFTEWLGKKADDLMWNLSHEDFQNYYRHLLASGRADTTARVAMASLGSIMEQAFLRGIIPRNPAKLIRTPITAAKEPGERRSGRQPFQAGEITAILRLLDAPPPDWYVLAGPRATEWKTATLLGLCCGLRLTDATSRLWSDFNFETGTVTWIPSKKARTGREVKLPLPPPVMAHLRTLKRTEGESRVTPNLQGSSRASFYFVAIVERAGVETGISHQPKDKGAGRTMKLKTFHSLRHTLLTMLAAAGTEKQLRMLISDHDDPRVNDRYTHGTVERLGIELAKVFPDVSGQASAGGIQTPTAVSPEADPS